MAYRILHYDEQHSSQNRLYISHFQNLLRRLKTNCDYKRTTWRFNSGFNYQWWPIPKTLKKINRAMNWWTPNKSNFKERFHWIYHLRPWALKMGRRTGIGSPSLHREAPSSVQVYYSRRGREGDRRHLTSAVIVTQVFVFTWQTVGARITHLVNV